MNLRATATPLRVMLALVAVAAAAVALIGLLAAKSPPMSVAGLAVLGICLFALGVIAAVASVRAGWRGQGALAVAAALFGGLCMFGASGSLAAAIILALITQ